MAWLAVDKWNDEEYIFPEKPERRFTSWEYIDCVEGEYFNNCIELPKGTIERLTGKKITYTEELFDTDFYESYDAVRYSVAKSLSKFYKEIIL